MLKKAFLFVLVGLMFSLSACAPKHSEIIVGKYGKYDITMGQFEKAYAKNVGGYETAKMDSVDKYKKFLDLYLDYRMKLRNAEVRGLPEDNDIQSEVNNYKKSVGKTYLIERGIVDKGLRRLYERRKWEYRVSHIMFRKDTLSDEALKEKAEKVLAELKAGADFDSLAKKYSDDQFSRSDGGDIYYITAGQINIPEFEDAVYATKVGEIYPEPVKTRYGYHIIKVTDKNKARFKIRASHILIDFKNADGKLDTAEALAKIKDIKKQLDEGADFAELAKKYSEDPGSGKRGGDLGFFTRRQMVKQFDEAAFKLKKGETSGIVKTKYGYHIIKLTAEMPYPDFKSSKENVRTIYKKYRYQYDYDKFIDSLRAEYKYAGNENNLRQISSRGDSTRFSEYAGCKWRDKYGETPVFTVGDEYFTLDSLVSLITAEKDWAPRYMTIKNLISAEKIASGDALLDYKVRDLDKTDPEFKQLMDEYKNGIYIFKIQEDEVWNKIDIDSLKLRNFWEKTKDNYVTEDKVEFSEIFSRKDSLINDYYKQLKNGADFAELAQSHSERRDYKAKKGYWGIVKVDDSQMSKKADSLKNEGDISKPFKINGGYSIVKLIKKYPARVKTFQEAKAEAASLLQEKESKRLENEYISKMKKVYQPTLYYDELEKAFKTDSQ